MKNLFIRKKFDELSETLENYKRNYHYQNYLALNTKLYFWIDASDVREILDNYSNATDEVKDFICDTVTDKDVERYFSWWLDNQRNNVKEWIDGFSYSSAKYWDEEIQRFKETGQTSYYKMSFHEGDRTKADLNDLLKYRKESNDALEKLSFFESEKAYFLGRSGGWLCLPFSDATFKMCAVEDALYELDEALENGRMDEVNDLELDAYDALKDLYKYTKAIEWMFNEIKQMHAGCEDSFKHELVFQLTEDSYLKDNGFVSEDEEIENKLQAIAV